MYNLAKYPKVIYSKMGHLFPCSELVKSADAQLNH